MKILFAAFTWAFLTASANATQFNEGKQYVALNKTVPDAPEVMEFFSFNCPHCYQFEQVIHVSEKVAEKLPENTKIVKYHVEFLPPLGKELTQAWAVAMALGVEDKITSPMFEAVQKERRIQSIDDIRGVFISAGVKAEDFDGAWSSFAVKALVAKQEKAAADVELSGVPAMFVKGQYQLNSQGMDTSSLDNFVKEYSATVSYLVESK
ncbi:thiol:disulfide interchange protein DsbA [Pectobacterium sp. PL64]|uniref:thiol:disulfide interchange protein DsbA n=1 Tax=Pectobacterium TaxID=122277 RepID=UPI001969633D|nr:MULTISPECIES: thiol:disulfide interchange protein DsbA [Pectobacterium]MBN3080485.1 thiol:disulfide interchange protein DsbA [Pectobacterium polaris]UMO88862.1 thiol:disulfide interchange protein DsbA [Pectobacterium sp. PL64]